MAHTRYGGKVIRADAPESATENTLLETSTSRSPSWIRKGLSRANNNVEFWSKLHNTPGWAGQRASAVPFRATGGPWVAAKTDASAVSGGGESDDHDGGVVCGGRGYKKRGACLTGVCTCVLVWHAYMHAYMQARSLTCLRVLVLVYL